MFLIGDHKEAIVLIKPPGLNHWELACFGSKSHYRNDGSCKHVAAVLAAMRTDWHRKRTRVTPWGNRP